MVVEDIMGILDGKKRVQFYGDGIEEPVTCSVAEWQADRPFAGKRVCKVKDRETDPYVFVKIG